MFTQEELKLINPKLVPHHIAIIPDGNRRWAKNHIFSTEKGHEAGAKNFTNILKASQSLGVKVLTLYSFSTENWNRPKLEVSFLMKLLKSYLVNEREMMVQNGVRFCTIGDLTPFSDDIKRTIAETKEATASGKKIDLVLALNYGARDELKRAIVSIADDISSKKIEKKQIDEEMVGRYLDTAKWKDPELLIRTSGEQRISNFLLWQIAYCEIFTTKILWPDFTPQHLLEAIVSFQNRERRLGT